VTEKQYNIWLS